MTFRETREASEGTSAASVELASRDDRENTAPVVEDDEEETPQPAVEETFAPSPSKGEDPVRLYLKEIGKVSLLTAAQEVEIGRRIEVGDQMRRGETPADDVIVLAEGGELEPKAIRPVLLAFERIRRLVRKIAKLEASLTAKRRSAVYRRDATAAIGTARQAIQKTVAD